MIAKAFIGIPATASVGSGAAVFAETRLLIRAGTMIAHCYGSRKNFFILPVHHPTFPVLGCPKTNPPQDQPPALDFRFYNNEWGGACAIGGSD